MAIEDKLLDELMKDYKNPEDLFGEDGILKKLTKRMIERAMEAELTAHLGYEKHGKQDLTQINSRNGKSQKTVKGSFGEMEIEIPRDRLSEFEPKLIKKHQTRIDKIDGKILSMYARGMTTRDIQEHLKDIYGIEVSPTLVSKVTNEVMEEVTEWQNRPLDSVYPIVFLDALVYKVRSEGHVINKHLHMAIGINMEGKKDVLGLWIAQNEGAKFWLNVVTELKNRGVQDILIASVDGLKGFPEAINTVFPQTEVQICIVHMVRNSLRFVSYKMKKEVAADLKKIYQSPTVEMAEKHLEEFEKKWDERYPMIGKSWRANWERVIPFLAYPDEIRRVIYTTNPIESLNMTLRKVTKNRASFPNDDAAKKLIYLALQRIMKKWTMPFKNWGQVLGQFSIVFGERLPL